MTLSGIAFPDHFDPLPPGPNSKHPPHESTTLVTPQDAPRSTQAPQLHPLHLSWWIPLPPFRPPSIPYEPTTGRTPIPPSALPATISPANPPKPSGTGVGASPSRRRQGANGPPDLDSYHFLRKMAGPGVLPQNGRNYSRQDPPCPDPSHAHTICACLRVRALARARVLGRVSRARALSRLCGGHIVRRLHVGAPLDERLHRLVAALPAGDPERRFAILQRGATRARGNRQRRAGPAASGKAASPMRRASSCRPGHATDISSERKSRGCSTFPASLIFRSPE